MEIFEHNTYTINKYKAYLNNMCNAHDGYDMNIYNNQARDGNLFMYVDKGDITIRINSMYSPVNEAEIWAKNSIDNFDLLNISVMFGLGNGYCVREVLKGINNEGRIIVYEPSVSIFNDVLRNYDISDILQDERVLILVGDNYWKTFKEYVMDTIRVDNINYAHVIYHPAYNLLDNDKFIKYMSFMNQYIERTKISLNTLNDFGKRLVENQVYSLRNLHNCSILSDYQELIADSETAIIVSAGPSLAKNINMLKNVGDNAFVLAVDRSAQMLLEHNIIPDVIVSVDPAFPPEKIHDDRWIDIPLLCSFDSNKELIKNHPNKRIYFDSPNMPAVILEKAGKKVIRLERGGSVATAAFMACIALGFRTIILCGQDLAYGEGDITHSDGRKDGVTGGKSVDVYVEGINGQNIKSRSDWKSYLDFFEDVISRNDGIKVVDATEGGARIKGTDVMSLEDAISSYCMKSSEVKKTVKLSESSFSKDDLLLIDKSIDSIVNDINMVKAISKNIVKLADALIHHIDEGIYDENSREAVMLRKYISEFNNCQSLTLIIMYAAADIEDYVWNLYSGDKDYISSVKSMYKKYKIMFLAIQEKLCDITKLIYE